MILIPDQKIFSVNTGQVNDANAPVSIDLSSLPRLRHLTIRANLFLLQTDEFGSCSSSLATAVDILKTVSSLQRLTFEIALHNIKESVFEADFANFVSLLKSSLTVHRIDLYVYFTSWRSFDYLEVVAFLMNNRGIVDLAERGVLVLHAQEAAPEDSSTTLGGCPVGIADTGDVS